MSPPVAPQKARVRFAPLPAREPSAEAEAPARRSAQLDAARPQRGAATRPAATPALVRTADTRAPVAPSGSRQGSSATGSAASAVLTSPVSHAPQHAPMGPPPASGAPPAYDAAWAKVSPPSYSPPPWDHSSRAMEKAVTLVQRDVDRFFEQNPVRRNMVNVASWVTAMATVGSASAVAVFIGLAVAGAASFLGAPMAPLAVLIGLGAAAGGLALVAGAAYVTHILLHKALRKDPALAEKLAVLREMRTTLGKKTDRSPNEEALLLKVKGVLAYAGESVGAGIDHAATELRLDAKNTWSAAAAALGNKKAKAKRAEKEARHTKPLELGQKGERWFQTLIMR